MTLVQSHLISGRAGQFLMTHSLHKVTQRSLTCNFQAGQELTELETCDMTICTNLSSRPGCQILSKSNLTCYFRQGRNPLNKRHLTGRAGHRIQHTWILYSIFRQGRNPSRSRHLIWQFFTRLFQAGQATGFNTQEVDMSRSGRAGIHCS